jgi:iron complex outermembrane receptor protein
VLTYLRINQIQLGFTLDEIPLGDMSYGNWNGLHISRAIMDENIGRIVLSQGTGSLETASNGNLDQSFGSFNAFRTVGRYESGLLGKSTKFYIAGVSQNKSEPPHSGQ